MNSLLRSAHPNPRANGHEWGQVFQVAGFPPFDGPGRYTMPGVFLPRSGCGHPRAADGNALGIGPNTARAFEFQGEGGRLRGFAVVAGG